VVPGNAGVVRDIRANMERTSLPKGLDHHGPDVVAMAVKVSGSWAGKGIDAMGGISVGRARSPYEGVVTVGDPSGRGPDLA
jgi:hypothetical protein